MSLLTKASQKSRCRGYEYFIDKKVLSCDKISDCEYEGTVQGTKAEPYEVRINLEKTLSSTCDCPFANGRKICKHMIAVFYTAFPNEAQKYIGEYQEFKSYSKKYHYDRFYDDYDDYDECYDNCDEDYDGFEDMLRKHIKKLSKAELQEALLQVLYDGPEWQFDRFINEYIEW